MVIRLIASILAVTGAVAAFTTSPSQNGKALFTTQRTINTARYATLAPPSKQKPLLENVELPEKLYFPKEKEIPKVLGGLKIGFRELVVITGASSGLGLNCAVPLAKSGKYFVVMACRDVEKAKKGEYE